MASLLYTTVSRHASVAYVSVQLGHPCNFNRERAESTYNELCQECQRLLNEECITLIRLTLFIYDQTVPMWDIYSEVQTKLILFRKLIGHERLNVSVAFISRKRPRYSDILIHKVYSYRLGVDVCYAEPS